MARRSGAGQAPSAIPILILVSTHSSHFLRLVSPAALDTTAGEENGADDDDGLTR